MATTIGLNVSLYTFPDNEAAGYTFLQLDGAATGSDPISRVKVKFNTDGTGVKVGTFYLVSGTTYAVRDYVLIGNVTAGSVVTVTDCDIACNVNDVLGFYASSGAMGYTAESGAAPLGVMFAAGDKFGGGNFSYGGPIPTEHEAMYGESVFGSRGLDKIGLSLSL